MYVIADAAASTADMATRDSQSAQGGMNFLKPITESLEFILKFLQTGLDAIHVPYSYGFSIILLTLIVKTVTYPFTKKQVESSMAMQELKPRIDNIKARYGNDKEKVQRETSLMYEEAGVDPLAGCLPSIATIPILWGLYRALMSVSQQGLLDAEGFFWIPSLAGPTTVEEQRAGNGLIWLYPFVNDEPPIGWESACRYLVLPVLLVTAQYISTSIISPPVDPNDENANRNKALVALLPLLIGWFSLNLPSGLSLYYLSNVVITSGQQIWLRKFGGANVEINDLGPVTKLGMGRRLGEPIYELPPLPKLAGVASTSYADQGQDTPADGIPEPSGDGTTEESPVAESNGAPASEAAVVPPGTQMLERTRSKRKKHKIVTASQS